MLYVALFLHDIAKGRIEDHSIAGARIARRLGPRLGLSPADTETVAWLIEYHLVMSTVAQSRDLSDRKTIENFAAVAQSLERLKLLIILTTADIRAVGPGVWNGWKAQLLRTLYYETEPVLTGGFSEVNRAQRVALAQAEFRAEFTGLAGRSGSTPTWRGTIRPTGSRSICRTRSRMRSSCTRREAQSGALATEVGFDAARGVTELTVLAPDHPRLLSIIAGACAIAGANIVDAQIYTTTDGLALDTISISREFAEQDDDEARRAGRIADTIEKALRGQLRLPEVVAKRGGAKGRLKAFAVEPEVMVNNAVVQPLHGDRGDGARPARPALRAHRDDLEAQPQHRVGARRDLRRARGRRVLRHRPVGRQDRRAAAPGGDQARADPPVHAGGDGQPARHDGGGELTGRRKAPRAARALSSSSITTGL